MNTCIHLTLEEENEAKQLTHANELQRRTANFVGGVGGTWKGFQKEKSNEVRKEKRQGDGSFVFTKEMPLCQK